ncbi:hypothetical protein HYDPIDRAFT_72317, partial [Hydnomerulius pinastri MD-312]
KQQKKSKMHQCEQCNKVFPRPSGLATHMNSHSGAKPYKCSVPNCDKSFAVRSNAKRHLRTHGINPSACESTSPSARFTIGFDEPLVTHVHDAGWQPSRYRWIAQPLATRTSNKGPAPDSSLSGTEPVRETPHAGSTFHPTIPAAGPPSQSYGSDDEYDDSASQLTDEPYHY